MKWSHTSHTHNHMVQMDAPVARHQRSFVRILASVGRSCGTARHWDLYPSLLEWKQQPQVTAPTAPPGHETHHTATTRHTHSTSTTRHPQHHHYENDEDTEAGRGGEERREERRGEERSGEESRAEK